MERWLVFQMDMEICKFRCRKAANTETILYGMRRIKQAGYTPMYYSYKPFTLNHVNYQQIIKEFPNLYGLLRILSMVCHHIHCMLISQAWMVLNLAIYIHLYCRWLDGNVDLTGITDNGYTATDNQKRTHPSY